MRPAKLHLIGRPLFEEQQLVEAMRDYFVDMMKFPTFPPGEPYRRWLRAHVTKTARKLARRIGA